MVDSLDTLWITGLKDEFKLALGELKNIDFTHKEGRNMNLFETTIRYLGGFLSAWDLSGERYPILVEKAVELGEVLYTTFDTPNQMPTPHFTWSASDPEIRDHSASGSIVLAVLAMVDSARYNHSVLLGSLCIGGEEQLTLGALANSTYEYLPKKFIKVAKQNLFFRLIIVNDEDLFISGIVDLAASEDPRFSPDLQHLTCFTGGMLAVASKIFNRPENV
ncbi:glycoside hydrolase [Leptodontidium sp. MPI-SDFR-AT-0119]|nr:glycoside hydrolase [Leptodontidium sp. MPI-SDFR-AT-0119]